jgi:hypothetical protein
MLPRDQICDVDPSPFDDPEDGVGQDALRILSAKDDDLQAPWTWESIWTTLFPDDDDVPDPGMQASCPTIPQDIVDAYNYTDFQPVIELDEVQQAFDDELETLKESLCEKLELLVPGVGDHNYLSFLAGQLGLVFDTHRANIMKQCRNRVSGTKGGRIPESRTPTPALGLGLMLDAQSQEQQQKQPSKPPMKLNRRSRRSTLLQALHSRNSTQQSIQQTSPSEPRRSPGPMFRQSSPNPRRPSRDLSRSSLFITRRTSATTGTSSRTTTPSFPILPLSMRSSGSVRGSPQDEKAANRYPSPETTPNQAEKRQQHQTCRELRDSGISVSGDVCDAAGQSWHSRRSQRRTPRTRVSDNLTNRSILSTASVAVAPGWSGNERSCTLPVILRFRAWDSLISRQIPPLLTSILTFTTTRQQQYQPLLQSSLFLPRSPICAPRSAAGTLT